MKIIKLTMNAFSTYHQKTVIDFEDMLESGLYLICGATGAGKTTIFDAITFALYGQASGSERQTSSFRSDYASTKEETYVELVFSLHHQVYTIKRSPSYYKNKNQSKKRAQAYLTYNNYTIEGIKEVNAMVNQLLGVDVHQFKQIVMIAQGEFTKLIYADSEEREKVLRHIFHTESLVTFENLMKEKTKQQKEDYLLSTKELSTQFQMLDLSEEFLKNHPDFLPQYIEDAKNENQEINQQYLQNEQLYQQEKQVYNQKYQDYYRIQQQNQDILKYQSLKKDYYHLLEKKEDMEQLHHDLEKMSIIQQHQEMLYSYQQVTHQLHQLSTNKATIQDYIQKALHSYQEQEKLYQTLPDVQKQLDQLLLELHYIQQSSEKQKQYQQLQSHEREFQLHLERYRAQYQEFLQRHEDLSKRMERDQENVDRLPQLQLQLKDMEQQVIESQEKRLAIHELSDKYDLLKDIQDQHYELSQVYQKLNSQYIQLQQQYFKEDEHFKAQQAGLLAKQLIEGQPCPVCGSLHHPQKALMTSTVMSSHDLELLLEKVEKAREKAEEAYQEVLSRNEQKNVIQSHIDVYKSQLHIDEPLSKEVFVRLLSNITQLSQKQKKDYNKFNTEVAYLKKIKTSLSKDQQDFQKQVQALTELKEEINDTEKQLGIISSQLQSLKDVSIERDYQKEYTQKQQEHHLLEKNKENIENNYHQSYQNLTTYQQRNQDTEKQIIHLQKEETMLKQQYQSFIQEHFQDIHEYDTYYQMMNTYSDKQSLYQNYCMQEQSLRSQLDLYQHVENLNVIDTALLQQELTQQENDNNHLLKEVNNLKNRYQKNQSLIHTMETLYTRNQKTFKLYEMYQDLYDYTSGKNPQRISFERYVLSSYFEHILEYANMELRTLSQGRFALRRKEENKGVKQQGLDLMVLDYETGMYRDIRSLSGGESFKAALSLALGLSAMIQSYAGGIELDTLFIDEGFGSLDSESLDQALNVLMDLHQDHKVIGIISHVRELKEKIPVQLIVEKSKDGSVVHIEKE